MRPVKLTITGFGPYPGTTIIDFDKLGEKGLYLVTGDTGSGKTTIFDAICFALYGEPSGGTRTDAMLRSTYCSESDPTEVSLTFSYNGKTYTIKRNPKYTKLKSSGTGTTEQAAKASLILPDGKELSKISEVNAEIREIIGLDRKQFSQIAMIAQGEFMKILTTNFDERLSILREIFKTEKYLSLQKELHSLEETAKSECEGARASISQYLSGISCADDNVHILKLEEIRNGKINTEDALSIIQEIIDDDSSLLEKHQAKVNEFNLQLESINKKIGEADFYNKTISQLNEIKLEIEKNTPVLESLFEKLDDVKTDRKKAEDLVSEIAGIEKELPEYESAEQKRKDIVSLKKALANAQNQNDSLTSKFQSIEEEIASLNGIVSRCKDSKVNLEVCNNNISLATNHINSLTSLKASLGQYNELLTKLSFAQSEYLKASSALENKNSEFDYLNKRYLDEQAGIMASKLTDSDPCPVCGSKNHPRLACIATDAPSAADVEKAKKAKEKASLDASNASNNAANLRGMADSAKKSVIQSAEELLHINEINNIADALDKDTSLHNEKLLMLKKEKASLEKDVSLLTDANNLLPKKEEERKGTETSLSNVKESITTIKAQLGSAETELEVILKKLRFSSRKDASDKISMLEKERNNLISSADKTEKDYNKAKNNLDGLTASAAELEKSIANVPAKSLDALTALRNDCASKREALLNEISAIRARIDNNCKISENVHNKDAGLVNLEKKLVMLKSLSDTANGSISGQARLSLETYILAMYFERIIERANIRLMVMSGAKYELRRSESALTLSAKSGLDLNVYDHTNATVRSVKSLSGGESFMAALSLALGLADEISENSGGIKIDTMFVDEGFGSLDSESLEQAMKALGGLAEGNRLVGIISHVESLKSRIDKQLVVKKDATGASTVTIINN